MDSEAIEKLVWALGTNAIVLILVQGVFAFMMFDEFEEIKKLIMKRKKD